MATAVTAFTAICTAAVPCLIQPALPAANTQHVQPGAEELLLWVVVSVL